MNPRVLTALSVWISTLIPSQGCGPFFPDTVLDKPQAALAVPPVSYLHNLCRLAGKPLPADPSIALPDSNDDSSFARQIPHEIAELREVWQKDGIPAGVIEQRIRLYEEVRGKLLSHVTSSEVMGFPIYAAQPPALAVRPLGNDFPSDIADYVEAARLHAIGNTAEARVLWKSILDRPPAERRLRAGWAAWMLAKTSADLTECLSWYERVETEIKTGATDAIGLDAAAKSWRAGFAMQAKPLTNPVQTMHLLYDAFVGGKESAAIDLRRMSRKILHEADTETLRTAAADPLVRRLINLELHTLYDGTCYSTEAPESPPDNGRDAPLLRWLSTVETLTPSNEDNLSRVGWALYAAGRYEEAQKVLALCPKNDALALWLQAKFDLREGRLEDANQHLAAALRIQQQPIGWNPANPSSDGVMWISGSTTIEREHQSRLLADSGIVSLALKDYLAALESLRKGGFREDAAYLAECVISTDGLIRHVRKVAPEWVASANEPQENSTPLDPYTCLQSGASYSTYGLGTDNQLRYLLARRLAREKRLKEAREFMPPELVPVLDHYIALDRARKSGSFSGEARAAVIWRQALIHRHLGAELFSTEGAPDGGARGWNFSATSFSNIRTLKDGWSHDWSREPEFGPPEKPQDHAIPGITSDEISRIRRFSVQKMQRFHYRYTAADLAWEASRALPPNHPLLAQLYNTAGQWLAGNDPKASDRFYQAMVRRCAKTPEGQAADAQRWFLADLKPLDDLPALPAEFKSEATSHREP